MSAVFVSALVAGLAGFGFALVLVPLLLLVYEPAAVIPINAALSMFTTTTIAFEARRDVEFGAIGLLLPFSLAGLIAGTEVLRVVNPNYLQVAVGVVVVVSVLLMFGGLRLPGSGSRWGDGVAGSASGLLATTAGISGPPVMLLLASRGLSKHAFRANIALYFVFTSFASLVVLSLRGFMEPVYLLLAALLVPAAFAGKMAGAALLARFSERTFRGLTLALILATGTGAALSGLLSLL